MSDVDENLFSDIGGAGGGGCDVSGTFDQYFSGEWTDAGAVGLRDTENDGDG